MSYELSIPLKVGALEIEFESVDDLEKQLEALDVPRIERAVTAAIRRKAPAKKPAAKSRVAKKPAAKKRPRTA